MKNIFSTFVKQKKLKTMKKAFVKFAAAVAAVAFIGVSCTEDDITNPTITLTDGASVYVQLGEDFTDPGFTANDDKDGDLTSQVTVTGVSSVNTDQVGAYEITYTVSDEAGNTVTETRTVYVEADGLAGSYAVASNVTGPGAGSYNYTETITASSVSYNKVVISNFSGFANLTITATASGTNVIINETANYDWFGTGASSATISTSSSSFVVDHTGASPVAKITQINYSINYGTPGTDNVSAAYTKN